MASRYNEFDYEAQLKEKEYKPTRLKTDRKMWKLMLFNVLTLGLYNIFFFIPFSYDIDKAAPRRDGERTMNYILAFILSIFTFSVVMLVWHYQIAQRVEEALAQRNIEYEFGTADFWGWYFVGSFVFVGPFVYFHKLCKAMNLICENYNASPAEKAK